MLTHASIEDLPVVQSDHRPPSTITAGRLALAIGRCDLGHDLLRLEAIRPALIAAIEHLVTATGRAWVIDPDEPMVGLARMLGRLAAESPDVAVAGGGGALRPLVDPVVGP
jgi:hypothetical protein